MYLFSVFNICFKLSKEPYKLFFLYANNSKSVDLAQKIQTQRENKFARKKLSIVGL